MAINYPRHPTRAQALAAVRQVLLLIEDLPCPECQYHATKYITRHPVQLGSSEAFQLWAFQFHNKANARLGKPELTYDEYRGEYDQELAAAELQIV